MAGGCAPRVNGVPRGIFLTSASGQQDPQTGGSNRKIVTKDGLIITKAAGDGAAHDFSFTVKNPSSRLRASIEVFARSPSLPSFFVIPAGITWQIRSNTVDERDGSVWPLQLIYGPVAAPDGYELDSAVRHITGTVFVPSTASFFGASAAGGSLIHLSVQCSWEPDEESSDASDLAQLFSGCSLSIDGQPTATTFN